MSTPTPTSSPAPPATNNTSPPPSSPSPPTSPPPAPVFQVPPPPVVAPPPLAAPPPLPPVASPPPPPPPVSTSPPPDSSPPPPSGVVPPPVISPPAPPGAATPPSADSPPAPPPPVARPSPPSPPGSNAPPTTPSTPSPPSRTPPSPGSITPPSPSSSSSTGIVVGAVVAGVVVLAVVAIVLLCCFRKKKKKHDLPEYRPPPPPYKGDPYGGGQNQWAYYAPPPADIVGKVPPHLSPPPGYIARPPGGPSPQPSLPPPPNSYSGGSGSNDSGTDAPSPRPFFGLSKNNTYSYEELSRATEGFSNANLLGQGAFGYVYKGMLADGREVAIKQRKVGSWQGEKEFDAEVEIISRVHHRHLVSLVGYCSAGDQKMLVYEFVPNNTLEFHLHGKGRPTLEWSVRQKIALGAAKGLAYLHEDCHPKIIHRDIKAANILLDFTFEAKVADFGLAKDAPDPYDTQFPTRVVGTPGYLAPEYASSGNVSYKSDVYSFGVMLLELITGRRPINSTPAHADDGLVNWAMPLLKLALVEDDYEDLVDPNLQNNYDRAEMARMVACAAGSVRHLSRQRPLMSQIVRTLEGGISLDTLKENGIPPGRRMDGSSDYDSSSQQYNTTQRNKDMMRHRQLAFESEVYTSTSSSSEGQITREMVMGRARQGY